MYERPTVAKATARRAVGSAGRTVVLGGGTGGLVAARELRHRLPAEHRVVLVDRAAEHVYQPSLLWQMVGERRPSQFTPAAQPAPEEGHRVPEHGSPRRSTSRTGSSHRSGDLDYDSLVVSLGAQLVPETVPGFDEMAHNLTPRRAARRSTPRSKALTEGASGS